MAQKKYRRKNRLIKFYMDVPEDFTDDDDFAETLMDVMDSTEWQVTIDDDGGKVDVNKIVVGDVEVGPENEDD